MVNDVQTNIRIPADIKDRIAEEAKANGRSFTAELVWRLEQSFDSVLSLPADLRSRIVEAANGSGRSFDAELAFWLESYMAQRAREVESIQKINEILEDLTRSFEDLGKGKYATSRRQSGMFPGAGKTDAAKGKGKASKDPS